MNFFDDLDKLNSNQDNDEFSDLNNEIYDEHDFILSPDRNPEFFEGLCNMCKDNKFYYNENGFSQEDLDKITYIDSNKLDKSYFEKVTSLDELQYFNNLKYIYSYSFSNCKKLKSIKFPKNLEEIFEFSFYFTSLKEVIFPENFKKINLWSFLSCCSLSKLIFNSNIKNISEASFANCQALKEITIPKKFQNKKEDIFTHTYFSKKVKVTYI